VLETKGAPEAVLPYCISELREGAAVPLTADRRRQILAASTALADGTLRVLSLAYRDLPAEETFDSRPAHVEHDLVHVGLVGMLDPPRSRRSICYWRS
jgi:P-type Ca2+ transporter type 2C